MAQAKAEAEAGEDRGDEVEEELGSSVNQKKSGGAVTDRKMTVNKEEWSICTRYSSIDVTSVFMKKVDVESLSDGLLIVPTLSERGAKGGFTLEVHSDFAVSVLELPEARSKTLAGEWTESTAGGSHLNPDWKKNPRYSLTLDSSGPSPVKITLSRSQASWTKDCAKDSIGCMMGFYLMVGDKPNRDLSPAHHDGRPWSESAFVPLHSVCTPEGEESEERSHVLSCCVSNISSPSLCRRFRTTSTPGRGVLHHNAHHLRLGEEGNFLPERRHGSALLSHGEGRRGRGQAGRAPGQQQEGHEAR